MPNTLFEQGRSWVGVVATMGAMGNTLFDQGRAQREQGNKGVRDGPTPDSRPDSQRKERSTLAREGPLTEAEGIDPGTG